MSTYEFGIDSELSLPDELQVVELGAPAGDAIDDIQAATLEAVRSPLEFPPLKDIVVPGDRVTLALANELPRSATVIAAIIQELLELCQTGFFLTAYLQRAVTQLLVGGE